MSSTHRRMLVLATLATGLTLATGCSVTQAVLDTIRFALNIVNVWV